MIAVAGLLWLLPVSGDQVLETWVPDPPTPPVEAAPAPLTEQAVASAVAEARLAAAQQPFPQVCVTLLGVSGLLQSRLPGSLPAGVLDDALAVIGRLLDAFDCSEVSSAPPEPTTTTTAAVCPVNLATRNQRVAAQVAGTTTVTLAAGEKTTVGSPRSRCIKSTSLVVSAPPGAVTYQVVQGGVEVRCNAPGGGSVRVDLDDAMSPNPFFIVVICT